MRQRTGDQEDKTMTTIKPAIHKFDKRFVRLTLLSGVIGGAMLLASDGPATQDAEQAHADHGQAAPATLVQLVRQGTKAFADVNAATAAGYQPFLGCVSGPDHGAMGYHYVNGALVGAGVLDATRPQVMIYEASNGGLQLVGVEFVVLADSWLATHNTPPVLEGQTFQYVPSPSTACPHISNCTSGPGGTTPMAPSWTGIIR
jgi:hypothetical protein